MVINRKQERAEAALRHIERMTLLYGTEIERSIRNTVIYEGAVQRQEEENIAPYSEHLVDTDSVTAAFAQEYDDLHMAILNFASYLHPGGGFLRGSMAQEEALCHESVLYTVLNSFTGFYEHNARNKNRSLYTGRAIFSPNVVFVHNRETRKISVLTCAAPNFTAASQNYAVSRDENSRVLRRRIRFILDILNAQGVEKAILGAFGCGVFGQNPDEVARLFREETSRTHWTRPIRLIYAIPQGRGNENYQAFKKVFLG